MALTARHPGADLRILVPGKFAWYCVPEQVAQREASNLAADASAAARAATS